MLHSIWKVERENFKEKSARLGKSKEKKSRREKEKKKKLTYISPELERSIWINPAFWVDICSSTSSEEEKIYSTTCASFSRLLRIVVVYGSATFYDVFKSIYRHSWMYF